METATKAPEQPNVQSQVMDFLSDVQEYGQSVFEKQDDGIDIDINTMDNCEVVDSQYGKSLKFHVDGATDRTFKYVPIKGESISSTGKYNLANWKALRDWEDYNIITGQQRKFATPLS